MKSGFALILGRSNVGKSTLLNALVGTKIAAVTPKPQTTRNIIQGVYNDERGQIVFVDTPGIFKLSHSRLTSRLNEQAKSAADGIDIVLYMVDPTRDIGDEEKSALSILKKINAPKILVINKIDLPKTYLKFIEWYYDLKDEFNDVVEVSALKQKHLKKLVEKIFDNLHEGAPAYSDGQLTNINRNFWIAEIIREKIFLATERELPYNSHVIVDEIQEKKTGNDLPIFAIKARMLTTNDTYKKMLIGHAGAKIKEIGSMARKELETALNQKVFLDLTVETNPHWLEQI